MDKIIEPGPVEGEIDPPSSKSYAIRALAADFLAGGGSHLNGLDDLCDDVVTTLNVIETLRGVRSEIFALSQTSDGPQTLCGAGADVYTHAAAKRDGEAARIDTRLTLEETAMADASLTLDVGESGLAARLFTPIAALTGITTTVTGRGTLLRRPMTSMTEALRKLGVEVDAASEFLPITVRGPLQIPESNKANGRQSPDMSNHTDADALTIDGATSSQLLTGLLMALPLAEKETTVRVGNLRSTPYIDMTLAVMDRFGIDVDHRDYEEFYIPGGQRYTPAYFTVEGDWSSAACLLVAGAISGRPHRGVTVKNLNTVSLQADVAILDALSRAGARIEQVALTPPVSGVKEVVNGIPTDDPGRSSPDGASGNAITVSCRELRAFEFDATDCPDLFPALAVLAAACDGVSRITGTGRLRHKESDRAEALSVELAKLGVTVDLSEPNVMGVTGHPEPLTGGVTVDSHGDHRIAMALAAAALRAWAPVKITGAECASKSYANFWRDFDRIRAAAKEN